MQKTDASIDGHDGRRVDVSPIRPQGRISDFNFLEGDVFFWLGTAMQGYQVDDVHFGIHANDQKKGRAHFSF